ncbi:carotenoid cleavage dioxygenase [Altererythrobacter atlanticus]|uniref:Dioxygenase n=1 Tax=Croceibacterium atlanticum TaxID=1267766 RepID=A0A0F7KW19_9SPHN|nr:carotenoid oxygenase family protein [Croceibacterium atlanticum]AKH43904.1 Lignostilbene-alpha,beta-dioxygenase isozyme I [Croceibacterium atlanticum]MBB5733646.1 carotenoid cleavage dioxygenase [Croceibacterium atlanticum]
MGAFPQTIHFIGTNTPRRVEMAVRNLEVEGEIPAEVDGAFFRAVPDNAHAPMFEDDIALNADGMISCFRFTGGAVDFEIKYVETERYKAEKEARRALFGRYRNPFTDDPSVEGVDRTVANTTPVWHAGRLFMTKEDGRGYEINPHTLETIGKWDYYGALKSETFTAHPRIDASTGEMFFFGYEAGGLCSLDVAYGIADKDGNLKSEVWFDQPYCSSIHDFVITEKYAIFPIFPTLADLDRLKDGGAHWAHDQDKPSYVGIMPRYGDASQIRWIEGPKGVSCFHEVNAYDDGDFVHLDLCLTDTNAFSFMREAGGIHRDQQDIKGALTRWTIDMSKDDPQIESRELGPPGDLPRLADADQGRNYNRAWYLSMNPQPKGPPMLGGPVGINFNALLRIEPGNGRITMMEPTPGSALSEPVHVVANDPDHGGWLLLVVDTPNGPPGQGNPSDYSSELWILEADFIEKGPIAKVKTGLALRSQVHGTWVSRAKLDASKVK